MSDTIIKVENLSKKYIIGHQRQEKYTALRDVMAEGAKSLARNFLHPFSSSTGQRFNDSTEEFYALKDVSFEIKRGDRVGIIGRNGAGKSTLLKILSRITEPTSGRIEIDGRVASLLEVGTGFHPELTGRENIFLNGAILGMTRAEIRRKFDEIVNFAEIEKFLDTPVKRYSSGMYVRLAFSVAAHLEPEILVVDEVLAVGDLAFQKKCMGKMGEVSQKDGRTILFVSHNMQAILELCDRGILLDCGSVIADDSTAVVTNRYINRGMNVDSDVRRDLTSQACRNSNISNPDSIFKWTTISIVNSNGDCVNEILFYEPFEIVFRGYALEACENVRIGLGINSKRLGMLFSTHQFYNGLPDKLPRGFTEFRVRMEPNILAPGYYDVGIAADGSAKLADYITENAISFSVTDIPHNPEKQWRASINSGVVYYPCTWSLDFHGDTEQS